MGFRDMGLLPMVNLEFDSLQQSHLARTNTGLFKILFLFALWLATSSCGPIGQAMAQTPASFLPNLVEMPRLLSPPPNRAAPPVVVSGAAIAAPIPAPQGGAIQQTAIANGQGQSCTPPAAPNEIVELARALKWNPDLIYEYVHNNIETIPVYDSFKGAYGALIDGSGTPIDQAELMFVLLQQSCYTPQYMVGKINLTAAQLTKWLGTDTTSVNGASSVGALLSTYGFSPVLHVPSGHSNVASADIAWVWIQVPIAGTTYQFDPASKISGGGDGYNPRSTGLTNLATTALQYAQSSFLNDAMNGSSGIGTPKITGINRANVRNDLVKYSNNLIAYIGANAASATTQDIVGGASILLLPPYAPPASGPTTWGSTALPYQTQGTSPSQTNSLNAFRTTLTLTLGTGTGGGFTPLSSSMTFNSSDLHGHRLVIGFSSANVPSLLLDGASMVVGTGAVPSNTRLTARATILHPHLSGANLSNVDNLQVTPPSAGAANIFVIGTAWGGTSRGTIEKHRRIVQQYQQSGLPVTSEPVLGETLSMIGYTWVAECTKVQQLVQEMTGVTTVWLHAVGIIGMRAVDGAQGPYVDLPLNTIATIQRVGRTANPASATPLESAVFFTDAGMHSILESGSIEQTQPGAIAVSTSKLIDKWSQTGDLYDINAPEIGGDNCNYYVASIRPVLATSYSVGDLGRIDALAGYTPGSGCAANTNRIVAPSNGAITVAAWTGVGYLQIGYDSTRTYVTSVGSIITGGLSGGQPASPVPPAVLASNPIGSYLPNTLLAPVQNSLYLGSATLGNIGTPAGGLAMALPSGGDPVNLVVGSYNYSHEDIAVGQGAYPDRLTFSRLYDSTLGQAKTSSSLLGNGWMHNYDAYVATDSDGFAAMGENSPINGAAAIAALYVMQDILNQQNAAGQPIKPTHLLIVAAQVQQWLMEQMTTNAMTVTQAGSAERFILLTNGSYNAPNGSASVLSPAAGGGFTYIGGSGVTSTFNQPASSAQPGAVAPGRITTWTNAAGARVNFTYNSSGQLQNIANPATGRTLNLHYNTSMQLTSVDDNNGRSVTYAYDGNNNLIGTIDPLQQVTNYAYSVPGQLTQIFYPSNPTIPFVSMGYDTLGRPNNQADALGHVTNLFFAGTRTELDDPAGTARVSYFTARGKTLASIEGLGSATINAGAGNLTTYTYDGLDRVLTVKLPGGNSATYAYDTYSNPLSVTQTPAPGSSLAPLTTTFTYVAPIAAMPNFKQVQTVTDPLGLVTSFTYDPTTGNRLTAMADFGASPHFNATTTFTYDSQGRILTVVNPIGALTTNTYDATGNLLTVMLDAGNALTNNAGTISIAPSCQGRCPTTTFAYDSIGNQIAVTDANHTAIPVTDANNNIIPSTDPKNNTTTITYDANRRPLTITLPAAPSQLTTTVTYDADGRVLQKQQSSNGAALSTSSATYTPSGKIATATDATGAVARYAYDGADRLAQVTDAAGRSIVTGYDALGRPNQQFNYAIQATPLSQRTFTPNGKLANLTDANNNTTSFTYDGFDRLWLTTYPLGSTESLAYDSNSNVLTQTTRAGETIAFLYDTLNRQTTRTALATGRVYTRTYNPLLNANLPTSVGSPDGTWTFDYDKQGRTIARGFPAIAGQAMTVNLGYDAVGNRLFVMPPDGGNDTIAYDALNRPVSVVSSAMTDFSLVGYSQSVLTWDPLGRLDTQAFGQVIPPASAPPSLLTFGYARADGQVTSLTETTGNGWAAQYVYSYDPTRRENGRVVTGSGSLALPGAAGSITVTANALNQISSQSYNANGNVLTSTQPGTGSPLAYAYDREGLGQILSVTSNGSSVATYVYAPDGTRWSATTASGTTYFIQDERGRDIAEVDATGAVRRRLVYDGVHEAPFLVASAPSGTGVFGSVVYNHFDRLGSVIGTFDGAGNVLGSFAYLPYGETVAPLSGTTFGYAGYRYDAETGLYHTGARYYDPVSGRFLMPDPIGYAGGVHLYAYVGDDPLNAVDPTGLDALVIVGGQRSDSLNIFGHVSIAVTGGGIYSFGTGTTLASSVASFVSSQSNSRAQTLYVIKTTPQQDVAMLGNLRGQQDNIGLWDNCAARTCQALNAGGLLANIMTARTPDAVAAQIIMSGAEFQAIRVPPNTSVPESVTKQFEPK